MSRRIVFFTTGMTAGGAERVIATLANAMDARGMCVIIAMLKGTSSEYDLSSGVSLRSANLEPGIRNMGRAIGFYRDIVRTYSPDAVVSLSMKSDFVALLTKLVFRAPGTLIVSDRADPYTRGYFMQRACNALYRLSDGLVCQSENVARYYRRKLPHGRIHVIKNPLNEASVGIPSTSSRTETIVSMGRLSAQKNHPLSIKAFGQAIKAFPEIRMKIFGVGALKNELATLIRRSGLCGSVELCGLVPNALKLHEQAALFLFTSNYEGYPNALLEAAASGIPIVTTDFSPGTAHAIVEEGVNGYIVAIGDEEAVHRAILKVLSGSLEVEALRDAALKIRETHSVERITDAWLEVLGLE